MRTGFWIGEENLCCRRIQELRDSLQIPRHVYIRDDENKGINLSIVFCSIWQPFSDPDCFSGTDQQHPE